MSQHVAKLVSVNVGLPREISWRGRTVFTGIWKEPVAPEQLAYAEMPAGSAVVYLGGTIHAGGANTTDVPRRGAHLSYCLGWLRTEENNYLSIPPSYVKTLPQLAQEVLGYSVHDSIGRGGGYLGMVRMQDPVELIARGELG